MTVVVDWEVKQNKQKDGCQVDMAYSNKENFLKKLLNGIENKLVEQSLEYYFLQK